MLGVERRIESLIQELVSREGLEFVHVEYVPSGSSSILRVYIDKPGGVDLEDCSRVSRKVGVRLDVEDLMPEHYVLEVSSPGIERPLFREADYLRFAGREIKLQTHEKVDGRRNFTGRILAFSDGELTLECEGSNYRIPFSEIKRANLVFRFDAT